MATTISIEEDSGYPTETTMRILVSFTVTYAATYRTEFEVKRAGSIVQTSTGNSYTLSAGGSKSGLVKTFTGLSPGTAYTVYAYLVNASNGNRLIHDSLIFITKKPTEYTYYARIVLWPNGGTPTSGLKFVETATTTESSATITVRYDGSSFSRTGYILAGFTDGTNSYSITGSRRFTSSGTSESTGPSLELDAVWNKNRPANWVWSPSIIKGNNINITASNWNNFITRILDFYSYKGKTPWQNYVTLGQATRNSQMMATQAKNVRALIDALDPPISVPATVNSGDIITASFFNGLANSLNSIV